MATPLDYAPQPAPRSTRVWGWVLATVGTFLLFAICAPRFTSRPAQQEAAQVDLAHLTAYLDAYKRDAGAYPTAAEGLGALGRVYDPDGSQTQLNLVDPWGRPYVYKPAAGSSPPQVLSVGPDGLQGTADDIVSQ